MHTNVRHLVAHVKRDADLNSIHVDNIEFEQESSLERSGKSANSASPINRGTQFLHCSGWWASSKYKSRRNRGRIHRRELGPMQSPEGDLSDASKEFLKSDCSHQRDFERTRFASALCHKSYTKRNCVLGIRIYRNRDPAAPKSTPLNAIQA